MAISTTSSDLPERPLRFLHASDLHLERTPGGLRHIPDHLRSRLIEVPYRAARKLFEVAVAEQVDAVLLAGDVVDLSLAGPRAVVFLREQFELLAAEGIEVYWAGGRADPPHAWPRVSPLPSGVHVFPADQLRHFDLHRDGESVARIVGISSDGDSRPSLAQLAPHPDGLLTIGVIHGHYLKSDLSEQRVPYVAAGGRHGRKSFISDDNRRTLHYPGAAQGTSPSESGPHGCTLVTFQVDGTVRTHALAADVFRWQLQSVEADESTNLAELEQRLCAAAERLQSTAGGCDTFVRWRVAGTLSAAAAIRLADARRELLQRLRGRFGNAEPCVWPVDIDLPRGGAISPAMREEESILGDVLREVDALQGDTAIATELAAYVAASDAQGPLADWLLHLSSSEHEHVLNETRELCVALLSGRGDDTRPSRQAAAGTDRRAVAAAESG